MISGTQTEKWLKMDGYKKKFKKCISYLCKNYLNAENCRFPHYWWNYHEALSQSDYCITTNCLENLNLRLKTKVGVGYCSRNKASFMSMQDYLPHVTQVFSKSRSCRWSISVLASIPSSILILSTPRAIVYRVRWNQEPRLLSRRRWKYSRPYRLK